MKKYIFGAVLSVGLLVSPAFTQASGLTTVQINAIISLLSSFGADQSVINNVQASLAGSAPTTGGQSFCHTFNTDLTTGTSNDVADLRQALSLSGTPLVYTYRKDDTDFNQSDVMAVMKFQAKYGIRQTGYVGPMTRAKLNSLYGCKIQLPSVTRSINILSPNGGEYFSPGGKITVSFSGAGQADQYKIDLFSTVMAGDYDVYNLGTITGQKADLNIPTSVNLTPVPIKGGNSIDIGGSYRIRVSQITNQGVPCTSWNKDSCLQSESNYFTISTVNVPAYNQGMSK